MEIPLLGDIAVIFVLSVLVLFIFHKIKAPTIVGFLVTGVLAGPQGLGLIHAWIRSVSWLRSASSFCFSPSALKYH